jgi:hypothetical protein
VVASYSEATTQSKDLYPIKKSWPKQGQDSVPLSRHP